MRLGVIVLAYRDPAHLVRLLKRMVHPRVQIYLHVDRRVDIGPFELALASQALREHAVLLPRHESIWGSAQCVDAVLDGLRAGVEDGCDYFLLVSGQDYPLKPIGEIVDFFEARRNTSFLEFWPVGDSRHRFSGRDRTDFYAFNVRGKRELCIPRGEDASFLGPRGRLLNQLLRARSLILPARRFPSYAQPYAGSTWWNMTRLAADNVLEFLDLHPDYRAYHEHTWVPEEIFFQSVLVGTHFVQDHAVENDNLRLSLWEGMRGRTLTMADLETVETSGKLFARKFDSTTSAEILEALSTRLS